MNDFILPYKKYAQFTGRSDRKEFWYFVLFYFVAAAILSVIDGMVFGAGRAVIGNDGLDFSSSGPLAGIFAIGSFIPMLAAAIRRLHDTGKTGWWVLLGMIPLIGIIILIVFYAQKGQPEANAHGEPPEGSRAA
jgi:uncharacterized membrane protein YhaH (DUF805 family)